MDFDHLTVNLCVCNTVYNTLCLINKKVSKSNARIMDKDASKPQPIENEKGSKKKLSSLKEPASPSVSKEGDCI